jgi:hypothetical protein
VSEPAPSATPHPDAAEALESEISEAVALCGGDVRAALRATLIANAFLEAELERLAAAVSVGFVRRRKSTARQASDKLDDWREISASDFPKRK